MVAGYSVLPTETKEQLNQAVADAIRGGVDAIRGKLEGFLISIGPGPVISNGDEARSRVSLTTKERNIFLMAMKLAVGIVQELGQRGRANFQVTGLTKKFSAKYQMWPQIRHQNKGPQVHAQFQSVRATA